MKKKQNPKEVHNGPHRYDELETFFKTTKNPIVMKIRNGSGWRPGAKYDYGVYEILSGAMAVFELVRSELSDKKDCQIYDAIGDWLDEVKRIQTKHGYGPSPKKKTKAA